MPQCSSVIEPDDRDPRTSAGCRDEQDPLPGFSSDGSIADGIKEEKIVFSNTHLAIAEAKSRGGVALAPSLLVVDDLARAELRLTNYPDMPDRMRFWIVVNRPLDERRSVHLLADWLMLEAKHHLRVLKRPADPE